MSRIQPVWFVELFPRTRSNMLSGKSLNSNDDRNHDPLTGSASAPSFEASQEMTRKNGPAQRRDVGRRLEDASEPTASRAWVVPTQRGQGPSSVQRGAVSSAADGEREGGHRRRIDRVERGSVDRAGDRGEVGLEARERLDLALDDVARFGLLLAR